jgi:hypothetical protein
MVILLSGILGGTAAPLASPIDLIAMPVGRWQVTRGHVSSEGRVSEPKFRAVLPGSDGESAEVKFTYLGPSDVEEALASGLPRRQVGLKLRAADGCNLVYVMWRVYPENKIVVSLKSNPGKHTHLQCGNQGYRNYKPRGGTQPAALAVGSTHRLLAAISGSIVKVWADGALAWEGELDGEAASLHGPAGVRSDNLKLDLSLSARPGSYSSNTTDED